MALANRTGSHETDYPRPSVTVDTVVLRYDAGELQVLLIQRKGPPFEGFWALPGGFVRIDEALDSAATRELKEETGLSTKSVEQLYAFGEPGRDPRGSTISIAYLALLPPTDYLLAAADDAADARWFTRPNLPALAFDHTEILQMAFARLSEKFRDWDAAFRLLAREFTLSDLQRLYDVVTGETQDKRNFRRRILQSGRVWECGRTRTADGRPARLFVYRSNE